jgi:hypothetical protein
MTTFNWTISAVERAVSFNGLSDVIQIVHWRYRGTDENGISAENYGATTIGDPNPEGFTPYNEVTSSDVQGWLESIFSVGDIEGSGLSRLEQMKSNIQDQIELLINPTTIVGPLYTS